MQLDQDIAQAIREEWAFHRRSGATNRASATAPVIAGRHDESDTSPAAEYARGMSRLETAENHKATARYRNPYAAGGVERRPEAERQYHERTAYQAAHEAAYHLNRAGMYDGAEAERIEAAAGAPIYPEELHADASGEGYRYNPIEGTEIYRYHIEHGAEELAARMVEIARVLAAMDGRPEHWSLGVIAGVPVRRSPSPSGEAMAWHLWPGEFWVSTQTLPEAAEYLAERERSLEAPTVDIPE